MIVVEIQWNGDSAPSIISTVKDNAKAAEQAYHTALAAAAVSEIKIHSVAMLTDKGEMVKHETYYNN